MDPRTPRPGPGFPPASLRRPADPGPSPHQLRQAQVRARAAARYHDGLRVTQLAPGIRPYTARQDGALAYQAQVGARARQQYEVALTNTRTRQAQLARVLSQPAAPTAFISSGERRSAREEEAHQRELYLRRAQANYVESVGLVSGEYAPLVLFDPVTQGTAQGGLMVMGGVGLGAMASVAPAGLRWIGTGLEASTGLRASYTAWQAAPWAFGRTMVMRGGLDFTGQYFANVLLHKGWIGSFGEANLLETASAGIGLNPYTVAIGSAGLSYSINSKLETVFHSSESGHQINAAKFLAQASVGLTVGHFGSRIEERLAESQYRAWRTFNVGLLRTTPLWGRAVMGASLRYGQTYGTPLVFGVVEETGEGYFGEKASQWQKAREARLKAEQEAAKGQRPPHPDSPVFRDNAPTP